MATSPTQSSTPNWELAKALWLQDLPRKEIASRANVPVGALKARAFRGRWNDLRQQSESVVAQLDQDNVEGASKRIQNLLIRDVERSVVALSKHDPSKLPLQRLEIRERTASMMQKRAWSTLGLDAQASPTVVNLTMLSAIADAQEQLVANAEAQLATSQQPIDITQVASDDQPQ